MSEPDTTLDADRCWEAVIARDVAFDGTFVYAVGTTGIYCRPTCPSRRPRRDHVTFFADPSQAEAAGYRACQRCHPGAASSVESHMALITEICRYLEQAGDGLPTLDELAVRFHLSPYHLQRTFKRIVGVSPRQYADSHRQDRLKATLRETGTVTDALYAAGYGASSRLYEQVDRTLGMNPIHYRQGGLLSTIHYTVQPCALGLILVAATDRGICRISLGDDVATLEADLRAEFPNAVIAEDTTPFREWVSTVLNTLNGDRAVLTLPLDIQATGFQRKVWEALRTIPIGATRSYEAVAAMIDAPGSARAVAQACASNPVAIAIPCHRVVRKNGDLSGYRWGVPRKRAILSAEQAATQSD